ncbi:MAG TPA: dephospho-CoA kinase [Candidatus Polarisedimenticolaceae bacterium]|nr:dephospho-CoA kinase [Candidatus Polarisedimenticolaceae bacterium]
MTGKALRVGLTGGIASGKTTVAETFRRLGAVVLDADLLGHALLEHGGAAHDAVVARFGEAILNRERRIDRAALAKIVFADAQARKDLEAMLHPRILEHAERRLTFELARRPAPVAVLEAALLVETGLYKRFDRLVLAACSRDAQMQRLTARGLTAEQAYARLEAQGSLEAKKAVADYVIDTEGTLEQTRTQSERVYAALVAEHADRAAG